MEYKELRIGNLIKCGENILKVSYHEIRYASIYTKNNYTPIKLNKEYLLSFGFKKTNYSENSLGLCDFHIDLYDYECAFNKNWLGFKVEYVHELQNIYFALTKNELAL